MLALVAGALWLFQRPLRELVDRLRLSEVRVGRAVASAPGSAVVSGTAANGYVVARRSAALSSDFPARLVEMNVVEGARVAQGEVVARLYYDEIERALEGAAADEALAEAGVARAGAEVERSRAGARRLEADAAAADAGVSEARARLVFALADHKRVEALVAARDLSQSRLDEALRERAAAEAQLTAARARLGAAQAAAAEGEQAVALASAALEEARARLSSTRAARAQAAAALEKTYIRAPFDGIVVQKEAEVGEVVSPSSQGGGSLTRGSVATIFDPTTLEVQAEVPETRLSAVRVGEPALIYLDAWPSEPYRGRIDRIWPVADRQKATIEVRVALEGIDDRLRPEMGVRIVFLDERGREATERGEERAAPVLTVPANAVVRVGGETGVFLVERALVRFAPLELGETRSGRVVVLEGLAGGETVVLDPPSSLASGDRVRVKE